MRKSTLFSPLALMLAILIVFAACGGTATAESTSTEVVTITYCNFNSSGGNEETLAKMVAAFEEEYPNIKVEVETIGYDDYFTQMQTRVAGGTAPDCYELNIENFAAYANKGLLAEISGVDVSGLNETALGAFNVDGRQYGLPESFSNVVLIYNKDLFDQAGVEYPTSDWTQADVQEAAEKIRALGDDIYGIWQPITYNEFYKVVAQYGGALLNEDKTGFTINSAENLEAAQVLVDRVLVSNVQPNSVQQGGMGDWDMFMSGRLGMIPTGIWAFQSFTEGCDFDWDIAVEPGSTQKATHFFSNCVVMNPETEHPSEVATWLAWLTSSTQSADIRLEAGWDLPALKDLSALSSYLDITPPDNREAVFESLDYLVMPPVIEDYALMSDIITEKLAAAADTEHRKAFYLGKRERFNDLKVNGDKSINIEKAALMIFLNKTCFNGLYRVNKKGLFNVPMGSYKNPLICDEGNLRAVSKVLANVTIVCGDYRESANFIDKRTFVYFDPPYRPITDTASFTAYTENLFSDEEQIELAKFVDDMHSKGAKVVISNSDPKNSNTADDFFDNIYSSHKIKRVEATRMINCNSEARGKIKELLISNF